MYWYDYFLYMLPAYLLVLIVRISLNATISKYSNVGSKLSGFASANLVLRSAGINDVAICQIKGNLTDNYDPSSNMISLSDPVFGKNSIAAVGIAAHEAGHAIQYYENYGPAKLRQAAVKICNIGSSLAIPLIFLGAILSFEALQIAGIVCFMLVVAFQLITLPVEFNASKRAVKILSASGELTAEEIKGVKRVLTAAAMTYVGALAVSAMQLLYYVARIRRR